MILDFFVHAVSGVESRQVCFPELMIVIQDPDGLLVVAGQINASRSDLIRLVHIGDIFLPNQLP